jgi:hypothetical protein
MKKALVTIAIAFLVIGFASAQPWAQQNQQWNTQPGMGRFSTPAPTYGRGLSGVPTPAAVTLDPVSLDGTLELVSGRVAIKLDGKTYFVMIPSRLFGFVDGLKEGAAVKVEGLSHEVVGVKDTYAVRVESLEVGGKKVDLSATAGAPMMGGRSGKVGSPQGRMGRKGR